MGVVYRASDRLTGQEVALKRVTAPTDQLQFAARGGDTDPSLSLAQEFRTLASLHHPNIIGVLDYGFDDAQQPFFTMALLENAQTLVEAGQGQALETQMDLLVQTLQALVYLHRWGVLHRDLKPENVLVVDGHVLVLDFGVSVVTSRTMEYLTRTTMGTFAYLAPELFQGGPVTVASDLYAVGVMAYEILAGEFPYNDANVAVLLADVLTRTVDVRSIGVNDALAAVLERLLVKTREERYEDASNVIRDLCSAAGCSEPAETVEIRESFLQAAKFVERETELAWLSEALDAALEGQGSAWLIGGESGVGKSRLTDELRTLALVKGSLVLRGQTVSEGASPYHLWQEALRLLALATDLEDEEASVLKALVPDVGALLGRDVQDAPLLDPQAAQVRLFKVVGEVLCRQCASQPVAMILEDMQWIDSNSLALLEWLVPLAFESSLLLIGNYRDEERPHLPDDLPGMQVLKLERLSEGGIAELSESMVGAVGRQQQVVDLLQRETEGNPFFLVETVRALAEEAGQLDRIVAMALPEEVFAGGVQEVVRRRLNRVPEHARPLLSLAAVAGRALDLEVLRMAAPNADLSAWLTVCADVAVLHVQGGRWRFAHDKLREGVLEGLSEGTRPGLHQRVAGAIERAYPDRSKQVVALAHHWSVAGDAAKELHYAALAGQQALQNSANEEAVQHLSRAIELLQPLPETPERFGRELELQLGLCSASSALQGYSTPKVKQAFTRARELCERIGQSPQLVPVLFGLFVFYWVAGDHWTASELAEQIMSLAQAQPAKDPIALIGAHWAKAGNLFMFGEFTLARVHLEQVLALGDPEQHRDLAFTYVQDPRMACLSWLAHSLWFLGYPDQALQRSQEAVAWARELAHPFSQAFALTFASMFHHFQRDVQSSQEFADEAIALSTEQGFPYWAGEGAIYRGWALAEGGQIREGLAGIRQGLTLYRSTGGGAVVPLFLAILADSYRKAGHITAGLDTLTEVLALIEETGERWYDAEIHRLKGELLLLQGADEAEVERQYRQAMKVARQQSAKSLELRAAMSLSRLWQKQGKRKQAREVLEGIYGWFSEGFDTPDLKEAKTRLKELDRD
jgi:predicted ATPase